MALGATLSRRAQRWNGVLSGILLVMLVVLVNAAVRGLDLRVDVSEDQLFAPSPELAERLANLDDLLVVTAYFTGSPEHGAVQIARSRMVAQLKDFADDADGRMRLEFVDPNASSAAKLSALRLGIVSRQLKGASVGGAVGLQDVWLGLSLKYKGRERALPVVMPQTLEYAFASELFRLTRERVPKIGLYARGESSSGHGWKAVRKVLSESGEVITIEHLSVEGALPDDLDLLVVIGPRRLHPRAGFAIDQFVQKGGNVFLALEEREVPLNQARAKAFPTGLEDLLAAWGLELSAGTLWDPKAQSIGIKRMEEGRNLGTVPLLYPYWPEIGPEGLSKELPVTARLGGLRLYWCQALETPEGVKAPDNLERVAMVSSSADSYLATPPTSLVPDPSLLDTEAARLAATQTPGAHPIAVSLSGRFPSPFGEAGAPAPQLPYDAVLGAGGWDGTTTNEAVLDSVEGAGTVVVFADTDWLHEMGPGPWDAEAATFVANTADWMLLEDDLVALRSRFPRQRPLVDFLAQERKARGVTSLANLASIGEAETQTLAEDEAEAAASWRRTAAMLKALFGSVLLAVLCFGLPGFLRRRRASVFYTGGGA
jgi:ABC-type uncharacterized transport system involved in gliding motility auxiliary subunit